VLATRWSIFAADDEEAWEAIFPWRGLRAPGRLEAVDPADLREMADTMPRDEILGRYTRVRSADEIVEAYRPLVRDLDADVVTLQMAALDQPGLIRLLGSEVLPALKG
jgi:coenzyme F420-dependent glucose-6-phosphate dehydrogenase